MLQVASLRYGVIFKKAFSKPHIFIGFVRDITGIQLEIDKVETEKEFTTPLGRIKSRFDLFAEDKKNRIIVDIQHERYPDHYHRFLHYHCMAILEQATNSKDYRAHATVLTIVVLTSSDHYQKDVSLIDFDPKDLQGCGLNEIHHKVIYLAPPYVNDNTPEPYRQWLMAIDDSLDGEVNETDYANPIIQEIFRTIKEDGISPDEYFKMKDEYSNEQLRQDKFNEGVKSVALAMLKKGLDQTFICDTTGLSAEDLTALVIKIKHGIIIEN